MEAVGTAIFISVIMAIKFYTHSNESLLGAFSVALTLYGVIMLVGAKTGGCLNPAVGLVQSVFQNILHS
jgi:glycerol uptake facilitator-like aquaporin|tara:strand:- start:303 stop:509 length:207 start_codon:yes stop_codon:yes gene_type:complete